MFRSFRNLAPECNVPPVPSERHASSCIYRINMITLLQIVRNFLINCKLYLLVFYRTSCIFRQIITLRSLPISAISLYWSGPTSWDNIYFCSSLILLNFLVRRGKTSCICHLLSFDTHNTWLGTTVSLLYTAWKLIIISYLI